MKYVIPDDPTPGWCCVIGCGENATWDLTTGAGPDDSTQSCDSHVAELLGDAPLLGIFPLHPVLLDTIDVVFDGPPSAESGRFVETEGSPGKPGDERFRLRGISAGEWIQDGDYWRLRFLVPSGRLVG